MTVEPGGNCCINCETKDGLYLFLFEYEPCLEICAPCLFARLDFYKELAESHASDISLNALHHECGLWYEAYENTIDSCKLDFQQIHTIINLQLKTNNLMETIKDQIEEQRNV